MTLAFEFHQSTGHVYLKAPRDRHHSMQLMRRGHLAIFVALVVSIGVGVWGRLGTSLEASSYLERQPPRGRRPDHKSTCLAAPSLTFQAFQAASFIL